MRATTYKYISIMSLRVPPNNHWPNDDEVELRASPCASSSIQNRLNNYAEMSIGGDDGGSGGGGDGDF
jgi:hypothetical protein